MHGNDYGFGLLTARKVANNFFCEYTAKALIFPQIYAILCYILPSEERKMKFSEKVIAVRGKLYVSQKQLADEIGVSFSTVNRWEQERHEPSFIAQKRFEDYCKRKGITFDANGQIVE
ncbi:hypothetical protein FACS1894211_14500 [Clostridia bacterium]|nr:hypothetical protein FACS1894211_14500 [Clostridia bacterium]